MTGKTHAAIGTALTLPFIKLDEPKTYFFIPFALLGSLMPDLDADYCLMRTFRYMFLFISMCFVLLLITENNISFIAVFVMIGTMAMLSHTEHRTIMHSLLGMLTFSALIFVIRSSVLIAFTIGYGSHLLMDSLTGEGIQLLYPKSKIMGFKVFRNRDRYEYLIQGICVIIITVMAAYAVTTIFNI